MFSFFSYFFLFLFIWFLLFFSSFVSQMSLEILLHEMRTETRVSCHLGALSWCHHLPVAFPCNRAYSSSPG